MAGYVGHRSKKRISESISVVAHLSYMFQFAAG